MKTVIKLRSNTNISLPCLDQLSSLSNVVLYYENSGTTLPLDTDYIIATHLSEDELNQLPHLKGIFLYCAGTDRIPVDIANQRDIKIIPSHANSECIAEHAIALAYSLTHRIVEFDQDLRNNIWFSDGQNYFWRSLSELNIGILGYGSIGHYIYQKIQPISKNIMVLNRSGVYLNELHADNLDQLINWCDLLFICLPKNKDTINLMDASTLQKMKDKYIVNISRAEICSEEALYHALKSGILAGYASDVWYLNPDKNNRRLKSKPSNYDFASLKNVILSPHCASHELSARDRYITDAINNCIKYLEQ